MGVAAVAMKDGIGNRGRTQDQTRREIFQVRQVAGMFVYVCA